MSKCNSLFQDKQEADAESAYQEYLKRTESAMAMSFEEFCDYLADKQSTRDSE